MLLKLDGLSPSDWLVYLIGSALALGTSAFAVVMISTNDGTPHVNDIEHLAIFAMPSGSAGHRSKNNPEMAALGQKAGIDPMPVGAISDSLNKSGTGSGNNNDKPLATQMPVDLSDISNYRIASAFEGSVLLSTPQGPRFIKKGSVLTGLGRVLDIKHNGNDITVTVEGGVLTSRETSGAQ